MKKFKRTIEGTCSACDTIGLIYSYSDFPGMYCIDCWKSLKTHDVMQYGNKEKSQSKSINNKSTEIDWIAFDSWLRVFSNTPPLKLKDLKERLKKEREEKRKKTK